jgi:ribosomal protein S18 acetylase RimI-like enzyme
MDFIIRAVTDDDLADLGRMGAALVRLHHTLDPKRFFMHDGPIEEGYGKWLVKTSKSERSVIVVAEKDHKVVAYAWGTLEDRDWMMLRDACGMLQDIWVDEGARREGIARALLTTLMTRLKARGAPRVVLMTAAKNETAQRFFDTMGFRPTMIEMTCETTP